MTNPLHTSLKSALKALTPPELVKSYGRLTRVNGLTLTATGGQFAMGEKYQVESVDGRQNRLVTTFCPWHVLPQKCPVVG